jgi:hypothetical protein
LNISYFLLLLLLPLTTATACFCFIAIQKKTLPSFFFFPTTHTGKTNHGRTLYGRATRHLDVNLCCIGALSFYLMYRFAITGEFEDMTGENWLDNSSWFDVKLLVDVHRGECYDKSMKNDSYSKAIKQVLVTLGIYAYHIVHLGRNLGAKLLEMLEEESEEIRKMGNWNPSIQDASYSTKLPMKPIRSLAGCKKAAGVYYNKRTVVEPPMELLEMTPVGRWVYAAKEFIDLANANGAGKTTASNFLNFMVHLNEIFIQDSAAMMIKHPERATHPVFHMDLFRSELFQVSFSILRCVQF